VADDSVTLSLKGEVTLAQFAYAMRGFQDLMEALGSEVGGPGAVRWVVDDLKPGSATATVRGVAANPDLVPRVVSAYVSIARSLEVDEPLPLNGKVKRAVNAITSVLADPHVEAVVFQTAQVQATVYERIGGWEVLTAEPKLGTYGAVVGKIQTLSNRRSLRFTLFDLIGDRAVTCYLAPGREEVMLNAWGRVAVVEGRVQRDRSGRAKSIRDVERVTVLPEGEATGYLRARGVAPREGDLRAEDAIRRLRDD
jgi:hypothetical protein